MFWQTRSSVWHSRENHRHECPVEVVTQHCKLHEDMNEWSSQGTKYFMNKKLTEVMFFHSLAGTTLLCGNTVLFGEPGGCLKSPWPMLQSGQWIFLFWLDAAWVAMCSRANTCWQPLFSHSISSFGQSYGVVEHLHSAPSNCNRCSDILPSSDIFRHLDILLCCRVQRWHNVWALDYVRHIGHFEDLWMWSFPQSRFCSRNGHYSN